MKLAAIPLPRMDRMLCGVVGAWLVFGVSVDGAVAEDNVFDRLKQIERFPEPVAAKTARERRIVRLAKRVATRRVIKRSRRSRRDRRNYIPLRRSIEHYVAAVADGRRSNLKLVKAGFVPCAVEGRGRCVAIVGDSCRLETTGDCEGMHLAVVIRVIGRRARLDRIVGGGFYLATNQDDIEDLLEAAP